MRPHTDLVKLGDSARTRLRRLRGGVVAAKGHDRVLGFSVLEAQNTWTNFARSFLLSPLVGARRRSGARVTSANAAATTPGQILQIAVRACKGPLAAAPVDRRDEPAWHDVANFHRACQALALSNLTQIQAALSLPTRVLVDMPSFRNFYAHRNEETAERAIRLVQRQYLIAGGAHPSEVLMLPARARPQALIFDWLDELDVMIDLMCD